MPDQGLGIASYQPLGIASYEPPKVSATDPNRKPAAAEDFLPPAKSWLDHATNFAANFAHNVDPRPALKLLYDVALASPTNLGSDPTALWDDVKGLAGAHVEQFKKAKAAYDKGRISEAVGHTLAGAIPLVGPMAGQIGEQAGTGDVSGAAGALAGMYVGGKALEMAPKVLPKKGIPIVPALAKPALTPEMAESVRFGQQAGIPIDAATATGRPLVATLQKRVTDSVGGGVVADRFKASQTEALKATGQTLAEDANLHPVTGMPQAPVTPEQAGTAAQQGVRDVVHAANREATTAYERLRQIEGDPANTQTIYPDRPTPKEGSRSVFAIHADAKPDDIFMGAWRDAKAQGFKGTSGELRAAFADKVREAKSLMREKSGALEESGDDAFLSAVREYGGLKPFEKDYHPGMPATKLTEEYENLRTLYKNHKGASSPLRNDGLDLDDLHGQMKEDPRWAYVLDGTTPNDLRDMLEEIGTRKRDGGGPEVGDLQAHLRDVGMEPGIPWWEAPKQPRDIALPVDLRDVKAQIAPAFNELKQQAELVPFQDGSGKATAYRALGRLMASPDHAPLSVVDSALGELKTFARADNPDLRSIGQGVIADVVKKLDPLVQETALRAGPDAHQSLLQGRAATTAKYVAADVLKTLEVGQGEPVAAYRRLTAPGDSAVSQLRDVAKHAPEALPKIGRAVMDGLLETATADGGFDKARTIRTKWNKLGDETKALLYKDPAYVRDVDNFLRLAERIADNPNPSGTSRVANIFNYTSTIVGYPVAKLLYTKAGVRLLTEGFRIPLASPTAVAHYTAKLTAALKLEAGSASPVMAADSPQGPTPAIAGK